MNAEKHSERPAARPYARRRARLPKTSLVVALVSALAGLGCLCDLRAAARRRLHRRLDLVERQRWADDGGPAPGEA